MSNLWYKVAEYYGESSHPDQQLDSNLWKLIAVNHDQAQKDRETYWNNLSSVRSPNDAVAYTGIHRYSHGSIDNSLFHRTCMPDVEKTEDKKGQKYYSDFQPVSFQELRQKQQPLWSKPLNKNSPRVFPKCSHCYGVIVPSRPHTEKDCSEYDTGTHVSPIDQGKCLDVWQLRPEGSFQHICQHGLDGNCIVHGGFDPKHAFTQGHISDEQAKAFGTSGDLEVLLGSEAEHRVKNNLPINLGKNNRS